MRLYLLFPTVEIAALYFISVKSYSELFYFEIYISANGTNILQIFCIFI